MPTSVGLLTSRELIYLLKDGYFEIKPFKNFSNGKARFRTEMNVREEDVTASKEFYQLWESWNNLY